MRVRGYPRLSAYGYEEGLGQVAEAPAPATIPADVADLAARIDKQAQELAEIRKISAEELFWKRVSVVLTGVGLLLAVPKLFELYAIVKERRRSRSGEP